MSIAIRLQHSLVGSLVGIVFLLGADLAGAQPNDLQPFQSLTYEYKCRRPACDDPLFVLIPGFTQHNRSPEFVILKSFLRERGFDYLIINPRQHGEVFSWRPVFSWGEGEVAEMTALLDSLHVGQRHQAVHLLGFSVGGKVALHLAAEASLQDQVTSVVAVATPARLGDIDFWLSGQLDKPLEGVISSAYAYDRAGPARLAYMALVGMSGALAVNMASPEREVRSIRAPTLLLHGLNDWLARSSHSKRLFRQAGEYQPVGFVAIRTHTHAEDMLSRHTSSVRNALLETLPAWVNFIDTGSIPKTKTAFNEAFVDRLKALPTVAPWLVPTEPITLMQTPVQYDVNTRLWNSAPDLNYPVASFNSAVNLNGDPIIRTFLTLRATRPDGSLLNKFRVGMAVEQERFGEALAAQVYVSLYQPFGSVLWFRRLNWIQSIAPASEISVISADLAVLILDFQVRYGRFIDTAHAPDSHWQLDFNLPLIGNAYASYTLGLGYSRFLSSVPNPLFKNNVRGYLFLGPPKTIAGVRFRGSIQVEQDQFNPSEARRRWLVGLSVTWRER